MMQAFFASFIFVLLAEMGDKTQLLAMAFAARYSAHKVLLAVFLATLLNHACAVAAGHFLATVIPFGVISVVAALSFIVFGLWTIRGDALEEKEKKESRFGPVLTVGIAFFLAEIGDKTQLATISLAVQYRNMISVLLGTTFAMVAADAIGIIIGILMRKHIPDQAIRWVSASIFILFGFTTAFQALLNYFELAQVWWIMSLVCVATAGAVFCLLSRRSSS